MKCSKLLVNYSTLIKHHQSLPSTPTTAEAEEEEEDVAGAVEEAEAEDVEGA